MNDQIMESLLETIKTLNRAQATLHGEQRTRVLVLMLDIQAFVFPLP
jgi:hypothetical protein